MPARTSAHECRSATRRGRGRRPPALLCAALLSGALASLPLFGCAEPESARPSLVLITVDALRADMLGCYGGDRELGVELCALAETGARYVWAFSAAASGAPSAASLLTSQYPSEHGVRDSAAAFLPARAETLAEQLRRVGYATAAFVSSPELNSSRHFQQGFDLYDDRAASTGASAGPSAGEALVAWTEATRRPWFAWVHLSEHSAESDATAPRHGGQQRRDEAALRRLDRRLSQLIAVLDSEPTPPGILLTALRGRPLRDEGSAAADAHPLALDRIRVPLLWRPPRTRSGLAVGRRVSTPVSLLDVAPTLLEAAGAPPPASLRGAPLPYGDAPAANGLAAARSIYAEHPDAISVVLGAEYAARPRRQADRAGPVASGETTAPALSRPAARSARLWPGAEPGPEQLPPYDGPALHAERMARLEAALSAFEDLEAADVE